MTKSYSTLNCSIKITTKLAQYYQLPVVEGVLIAQVEAYSPADDSGLTKGDIIEAIDGNKINDPSHISSQIREKHVSYRISMTINRYGSRFEIPLQLQARP